MTNTGPGVIGVGGVVLFALLAALYRAWWLRSRNSRTTPTGFGVFLSMALVAAEVIFARPTPSLLIPVSMTAVGAIIYWWDDFAGLSAKFRMTVAAAIGAGIAVALLQSHGGHETIGDMVKWGLTGALVAVFLVNMVNFYDGADLNLATYIALTAVTALFFAPAASLYIDLALACLVFIVPFMAFNAFPRTLYLGDAGSFAFAGLLTTFGLLFLWSPTEFPIELAIPSALPAFDAVFVFVVRLRERHDLLSRNYLHLYQRLEAEYPRPFYLVPQIGNLLACLLASRSLQSVGIDRLTSVLVATAVVTIPFYFLWRAKFVDKERWIELIREGRA